MTATKMPDRIEGTSVKMCKHFVDIHVPHKHRVWLQVE